MLLAKGGTYDLAGRSQVVTSYVFLRIATATGTLVTVTARVDHGRAGG
jgi:hypothetical protein